MSQLLGQTLGDRYRILSLLGSGGMGEVFLAEHVVLGKRMAVKVLRADLSRDEEFVQRFQQEAVAASRIGHENIVSVTDFGRTPEGAFYFVMEALTGTDLATLIRNEGIPPLSRAIPILIHVARALAAAHAQGIVHRDLKAENVMVIPRDDGTDLVKVLDFGISKMSKAGDNPRVTRQGVVMGTPSYMPPEQAKGETIDARSDIYSLGVLAYEVFTGTLPFDASTPTAVMMKHLTEAPEPPSKRNPAVHVPPDLEALVLRMMEKGPDRRPQSMAEVRDALVLGAARAGLVPGNTLPPQGRTPIPLTHPIPAPRAELARTYVSTGVRRARRWLALGGVTLALIAAAAVVYFRMPTVEPVRPPTPTSTLSTPPPVVTPTIPATPATPPSTDATPTPVAPATVLPPSPPALRRLTVKDVERVFGRSSAKLRKCLQDNRGMLPARSGSISVSFMVVKSGAVTSAKLTTPGTERGPLASCVAARVTEMKFPTHAENAVAFEIPLGYDFKDSP